MDRWMDGWMDTTAFSNKTPLLDRGKIRGLRKSARSLSKTTGKPKIRFLSILPPLLCKLVK